MDSGFSESCWRQQSSRTRRRLDRALWTSMLPLWRAILGSTLLRRPAFDRPGFLRPWSVVLDPLIAIRTAPLIRLPLTLLGLTILRPIRLTVARRRADFKLVQFVPLFIGAIPLRDGKKFANPATRINWLWIVHSRIMNHTPPVIQHR